MSNDTKPGFWSAENLKSLSILLLAIFCFRWSVASPYHVPTASMEPTIKVGDRLLALKLAYDLKLPFTDVSLFSWGQPQRGDIIVFRYPKDPDIDYVKRVIGLPGDKIRVEDNVIYINDEEKERVSHDFDRSILEDISDYPEHKLLFKEDLGEINHWVMQNTRDLQMGRLTSRFPLEGGEYTVPDDSYFVMGDNRDNSTDSRMWGPVPLSYVKGKALFVIFSVNQKTEGILPGLRTDRFGYWLH